MAKIIWDADTQHFYETGVKNCVLYVKGDSGYETGVAWNGITGITESPSGAEPTALWADDQKYLNLISAEEFGATVEAYTYPDKFAECDGSAEIGNAGSGVMIGQQPRKNFAIAYKTQIGNDVKSNLGYKLHIIYGATATPSEKSYSTINDSPEAITFSWTLNTVPVQVEGMKPTSLLTIDSTKITEAKLTEIENSLFGTDPVKGESGEIITEGTDPTLLMPDDIVDILNRVNG